MFVLKKWKYTWLDMCQIPFYAPMSTVLVIIQKVVTTLVNNFQVIVVAEFLDGAIGAMLQIRNQSNYIYKMIKKK